MQDITEDFEINEDGEVHTTLYFVAPVDEKFGPGRSVSVYGEFT